MFSRRSFLKTMQWAPLLYYCSPFREVIASPFAGAQLAAPLVPLPDFHFTPHYPNKSPLDDVIRHVVPGSDEYATEKYAFEIDTILKRWTRDLKTSPPSVDAMVEVLPGSFAAAPLSPGQETRLRTGSGIEVVRREFPGKDRVGREQFVSQLERYVADLSRVDIAEFEIVGITEVAGALNTIDAEIRYTLVGVRRDGWREQRIGLWKTRWSQHEANEWQLRDWQAGTETTSRARSPLFVDVSAHALGGTRSYHEQMLRGVDHWRTVLDAACGIGVYGNNGVAVGDFDNDGFDDVYVCQPAGLPNRLYHNRGDGSFEDATEASGLAVLDATACALFADFENKGRQDLLVVCDNGPLLFLNQGNGKFSLKRDAFRFEHPPQGTFTHAAIADYDHDGRLDVYFCLYNYYVGLDQYRYPVPYFDARNGPPNFLFHNDGNATFVDRTEAVGLNSENDRYSFACAWGDLDGNGWPDLYVVNDFGRNNLYRNNGDGTFTAISEQAGVQDVGAGMSATWVDFDNDGRQDLYAANMWSAAGIRVSREPVFHKGDPGQITQLYRQHASGNSLYRNRGDSRFKNVSTAAGADMGRWAWSSDAWDFDHDGYADLYIANGYISGPDTRDLGSFFWRHVVGKSPSDATHSLPYERGWNAINELIRSDVSWAGYERNVFYANNRDGSFSDISGLTGLDSVDDSRSFALADLDGDGRLEVVLKNRTAPQLRILRNNMEAIGHSIAFRLRGVYSNRDAIGGAVTLEAAGLRQTKYLQAGSGFLSQHTKDLFFGVGDHQEPVSVTIQWPSGLKQSFERVPVGHRVEITEGVSEFRAIPFAAASPILASAEQQAIQPESTTVETWLIEPLAAPNFSLPDVDGVNRELRSFQGGFTLLNFWSTASPVCREQLRRFQRSHLRWQQLLRAIAIHVPDQQQASAIKSVVRREAISFPVVLANDELVGVYNILFRYLYDRRRDLPLPACFLVDPNGMIVKVYQGMIEPAHVIEDVRSWPRADAERKQKALPFPGALLNGEFRRNEFTYGVALFQRGYLDEAAAAFQQVIANRPDDPEAYYNLGTLYLRRGKLSEARRNLEETIRLRPGHAEAWNNLGMLAAQQNQPDEAIRDFQESLRLRPNYTVALLNLGNLYRREGKLGESEKLLRKARENEPDNPEVNYNLGMLYGKQDDVERAADYLEKALAARPDYPDALNNLGVLLVREQRLADAEVKFKACIDAAPGFDQAYLNLARLYVMQHEEPKAKAVLESLLRGQPDHPVARQMLQMLR